MIPYFEWTTIHVGPLTLHVWGIFVALGFLLGAYAAGKYAAKLGLQTKIIYDLATWMVLAGLVGGRLGHVLFYEFPYYLAQPLKVLAVWEGGLSMFGGLIACALVSIWFLRRKQVDVWRYADAAAFGLPFGLMIGRIGCFLIHDHPGTATDFVLGVQYPDGTVRHDHGLYEVINGALMAGVFLLLARKQSPAGVYIGVFSVWYGVFRLLTDAWRIVDTRYFGLTPGQYLGFALALVGGIVLWITKRQKF